MGRLGVIIQARLASDRLPGKVLMDICGKPMLSHVVERAKAAVSDVYIVTPPDDTEIIEWAQRNAIPVSLDRWPRDLLDSYYHCAKKYRLTDIVRITADNPLIDPETIKQVVDFYHEGQYDYAANCRVHVSFPVGNDVEVFSFKTLERTWESPQERYGREHVTPYIYRHADTFKVGVFDHDPCLCHLRWTVDTSEDLENVREIYRRCYRGKIFGMREILETINAHS
jgi:spore coat polysaccharide biosynthesis protein SpsF (cytidylyltransferase family)